MRWPYFAAISILASLTYPAAGAARDRPVVVELFTSEGCSSCPPADRFLAELVRERRDVLALAFHVTYWNSLGWHDPYSLASATARQNDYASSFGSASVFTPQMVVDGAHSVVGSDKSDALAAIAAARTRQSGIEVTLKPGGGQLHIGVGAGRGAGRVLLVGFDHEHSTAVGRGENSGRTLVEANIVRSIATVGSWTGASLEVNAPTPAGETAAVLLQAPDGKIIGAATIAR